MIGKLGKTPVDLEKSQNNFKFISYLIPSELPPLPPACNLYTAVSRIPMQGNNVWGNCVLVNGAARPIQVWSANAAREQIIPDQKVIDTYLSLTGGRNTGLNVLAFLNFWRQNPLWGHPLYAFMEINPRSARQLQYAVYLFGGALLGFNLPVSAQNAAVWDVPRGGAVGDGEPGSWGGHLTHLGAYDQRATIPYLISTWDQKMPTSSRFPAVYCDEAYILLALDWFTKDHVSPMGFNWAKLKADLAQVTKV